MPKVAERDITQRFISSINMSKGFEAMMMESNIVRIKWFNEIVATYSLNSVTFEDINNACTQYYIREIHGI